MKKIEFPKYAEHNIPATAILYFIERQAAETNYSTVARQLGISGAYLSDILHGKRDIGKKVLDALGLQRVVMYERKP